MSALACGSIKVSRIISSGEQFELWLGGCQVLRIGGGGVSSFEDRWGGGGAWALKNLNCKK